MRPEFATQPQQQSFSVFSPTMPSVPTNTAQPQAPMGGAFAAIATGMPPSAPQPGSWFDTLAQAFGEVREVRHAARLLPQDNGNVL